MSMVILLKVKLILVRLGMAITVLEQDVPKTDLTAKLQTLRWVRSLIAEVFQEELAEAGSRGVVLDKELIPPAELASTNSATTTLPWTDV